MRDTPRRVRGRHVPTSPSTPSVPRRTPSRLFDQIGDQQPLAPTTPLIVEGHVRLKTLVDAFRLLFEPPDDHWLHRLERFRGIPPQRSGLCDRRCVTDFNDKEEV